MKLPDNSIGISDLLAYRECPRRMSYGMRRHTGPGTQSDAATPEARLYGAADARIYGSAIHELISASEEGLDDSQALQAAWDRYGNDLEPGDLDQLREDLGTYRTRDFPNTRTIASEDDFRVPLMVHEGEQIYFRFRIDRLYERVDAPGTFLHVDYKSSKHPKSQLDVHGDLQLWSYNFGIHERFPECETLLQFYDQLRYGQLPTRKSDAQRDQIKEWLVRQATSVLNDDDWQDDRLLPFEFNEWCPWCPILESCGVVGQLTDFATARIAALIPEDEQADPARAGEYAEQLAKVKRGRQVLDRFEKSVTGLLRELPDERRTALGYRLRGRTNRTFTAADAELLHERLGPRFYELVKVTKSGLESNLAEDEALLAWALDLAQATAGTPSVVRSEAA